MASRDTAAEHGDQRANVTSAVRDHYSAAAARVREAVTASRPPSGCGSGCGDGCTGGSGFESTVYAADDLEELPAGAVIGSLGCINPTALADLHEGETFSISVRAAASMSCWPRVGSVRRGRCTAWIGWMRCWPRPRENQECAGAVHAKFLKGHSVDVVISNCVVHCKPNKGADVAQTVWRSAPGRSRRDRRCCGLRPTDRSAGASAHHDPAFWFAWIGGTLPMGA